MGEARHRLTKSRPHPVAGGEPPWGLGDRPAGDPLGPPASETQGRSCNGRPTLAKPAQLPQPTPCPPSLSSHSRARCIRRAPCHARSPLPFGSSAPIHPVADEDLVVTPIGKRRDAAERAVQGGEELARGGIPVVEDLPIEQPRE